MQYNRRDFFSSERTKKYSGSRLREEKLSHCEPRGLRFGLLWFCVMADMQNSPLVLFCLQRGLLSASDFDSK